ncbi:MAG: hypothetical protein JRD89_10955, partial [Deltaproteobacteria bacterium]|nr:hypothetical protein [Deltaproteobacteria bacterium]
ARQIWDEARFAYVIELKQLIKAAVKRGDVTTVVMSRLENLFRSELEGRTPSGPSLERCPIDVTAKLLCISRQTLHKYHREKGLARNTDGTYNLLAVVPWYVNWIENKAMTGGPLTVADLQRHERGLEIRQRRLERQGFLVDSREVVKGLLAREQAAMDAQHHKAEDLARKLEGQAFAARVEVIHTWCDRQRAERLRLPEQVTLVAGAREKLEELLALLTPSEEGTP